jgi:dolichol-phosphate mannosyltransferase
MENEANAAPPPTEPGDVLIIIPTYNEEENLEKLIAQIHSIVPSAHILVIDDNSPDGTGEIADRLAAADERVFAQHRKAKLGLGTAYVQGFKWALQKDYKYIFEMDCDFSHDPREIPNFLRAAQQYDIVIGSRFKDGRLSVVNWPLSRLILSMMAMVYTRMITGMKLWDPTTGFKCFNRRVLEAISLEGIHSGGYSFQIEMNFRAKRKKFTIGEIPIIFNDRREGQSKMNKRIVFEAIGVVWKLRFGALREDFVGLFRRRKPPVSGAK